MEATYGPTIVDDETADLDVDVTIPLQALVHNSQLYVSTKVPKVIIWKCSGTAICNGADCFVAGYTGIL